MEKRRGKWKHSYGTKTSWHEKGQRNTWAKIQKNKLRQRGEKRSWSQSMEQFCLFFRDKPTVKWDKKTSEPRKWTVRKLDQQRLLQILNNSTRLKAKHLNGLWHSTLGQVGQSKCYGNSNMGAFLKVTYSSDYKDWRSWKSSACTRIRTACIWQSRMPTLTLTLKRYRMSERNLRSRRVSFENMARREKSRQPICTQPHRMEW